jgi:hypothetical protein
MRKIFLLFLMFISLIGFTHSLAFADTTTTAATSVDVTANFAMWAPLIAVVLGAIGNALRSFTPSTGFFHTNLGHLAISVIVAAVGGLGDALVEGNFTKHALIMAVAGAISGALGASKPLGKSSDSGSSGVTGPGPTIQKVSAMLPIAFLFASCAHTSPTTKAFEAAFATCAEAKGIAAAPGVGLEVWGDLSTGTNSTLIVSQLEALAGKAGLDLVGCAVNAWLNAGAAPSDGGARLLATEKNPAGVTAATAFLEKHSRTTSL